MCVRHLFGVRAALYRSTVPGSINFAGAKDLDRLFEKSTELLTKLLHMLYHAPLADGVSRGSVMNDLSLLGDGTVLQPRHLLQPSLYVGSSADVDATALKDKLIDFSLIALIIIFDAPSIVLVKEAIKLNVLEMSIGSVRAYQTVTQYALEDRSLQPCIFYDSALARIADMWHRLLAVAELGNKPELIKKAVDDGLMYALEQPVLFADDDCLGAFSRPLWILLFSLIELFAVC